MDQLLELEFPLHAENFAQFANLPRADVLAVLSVFLAGSNRKLAARLGYTEKMMSKTEHSSAADAEEPSDADWRQLEELVEMLQQHAHAPIEAPEFYRWLLEGCVALLAADGGTIWVPGTHNRWRAMHRINTARSFEQLTAAQTNDYFALLQAASESDQPQIVPPRSRGAAAGENPTAETLAQVAVRGQPSAEKPSHVHAVIEFCMRSGSSPEVQRGWQELLTTVAQIAADFHVQHQLRTLLHEREFYDQSLKLAANLQKSTDLRQTALEIANEGRRFVGGDRLSVVVRHGKAWRLLATSGVDRVQPRADVCKRLEMLARLAAQWGEPIDHGDGSDDSLQDLPPDLQATCESHLDESQARQIVAVPIEDGSVGTTATSHAQFSAVLIAEQFTGQANEFSRQRVLELAGLCEPALRQAAQLDRFPVRQCLRWANRWGEAIEKWGLTKLGLATTAAIAIVLSLMFVQCDYEIEAPATLAPLVQRDVFAPTDGKVVDVRITHGQQVQQGEVLAVLHDPQLLLDAQRVAGEVETTRKRLEAIAVARTDRQVREETNNEKLPLSAESQQLEKKLMSLHSQQEILVQRREALTLRSPVPGIVLTLDVQNLLQTRPVERGQVLFTIADTTSGWQLLAEVPQDRIGQVAAAYESEARRLPARFRLSGETEQVFHGTVAAISTSTVLETANLNEQSPPFEVQVQVDTRELPNARPGMNAQVRILCGRRSLGYVWFHDVWKTVYSWVVF